MKKILLGKVGVDSGQLLICDPCYIDDGWKKEDFSPDDKLYDTELKKEIPSLRNRGIRYDEIYRDGMTYNEAISKGILKEIPSERTGEFSYDGCCKETINDFGGELGDGDGVAFSSGFGDGCYNVWGYIKDYGKSGGERVCKVVIELIKD